MKAISFLGTTDYKETTYFWEGREFRTRFFGETLPHFFPELKSVLVFITPTVEKHPNWVELQRRLNELAYPVLIPEGHSEDELWEIFDKLISKVSENETVIFDITHSLRSLPLLVFLAAAYLRTARHVRVHRIIYGAWEARDKETDRSPVFDLTPFVGLLDWLNAANQFIHTGDARYLADVLRSESEGKTRDSSALVKAAEELREFSLAMMLCRPLEIMEKAGRLGVVLANAKNDLAQKAQPFTLLTERIEREYVQRALSDPKADANLEESLRRQLELIEWYVENNQIIQAMSLAREWLITLVAWRLGKGFVIEVRAREELARGIEQLSRFLQGRSQQACELNEVALKLREMEQSHQTELSDLWDRLSTLRNDLDHVGMSPSASSAHRLERQAKEKILPKLEKLAAQWMLCRTEGSAN